MALTTGVATKSTHYTQFTLKERERLFELVQAKVQKDAITKEIGKDKFSIYRELARNADHKLGSLPDRAQAKALEPRAKKGIQD